MEEKQAFEDRKQASLDAARKQGIVDVVTAGRQDGISPETVKLATDLMQKHGPAAYERLEARRNAHR
jgi:hypothetical protein